jgi:hypothetical protein
MSRSLLRRLKRLERQQPAPGVSFWDLLSGRVSAVGLTEDDLDDASKDIYRRYVAVREQYPDGVPDTVGEKMRAMLEGRPPQHLLKELPPAPAAGPPLSEPARKVNRREHDPSRNGTGCH